MEELFTRRSASDKKEMVSFLIDLPNQVMLEVLQAVFAEKLVYEPAADWHKSHFFLGIATSVRSDDPEDAPAMEMWTAWDVRAVGDYNRQSYPEVASGELELGSGEFDQRGTCPTCQTSVASIAKHAICPICGTNVFLT